LLYEHGIMINVPAPGRFAIHKCIVSQKRPAALAAKTLKDQSQAAQIFEVLLDSRPADITLAFEAAKSHGEAFVADFMSGLRLIDKDVAASVRSHIKGKPY